jgi:hypothetical protein
MKARKASEGIRYTEHQTNDAVDALVSFVEEHCEVEIGREFQIAKSEFRRAFEGFCRERSLEPPSDGLLGTLLVKFFPALWSDSTLLNGKKVQVWRNLVLKEMPASKNEGADGL